MINKGEKLVKVDFCFKLPSDFEGDLNDALQAVIDYRKGEKNHDKDFKANGESTAYENWWRMVNETDRPFFAKASISEFDGEKFNSLKTQL